MMDVRERPKVERRRRCTVLRLMQQRQSDGRRQRSASPNLHHHRFIIACPSPAIHHSLRRQTTCSTPARTSTHTHSSPCDDLTPLSLYVATQGRIQVRSSFTCPVNAGVAIDLLTRRHPTSAVLVVVHLVHCSLLVSAPRIGARAALGLADASVVHCAFPWTAASSSGLARSSPPPLQRAAAKACARMHSSAIAGACAGLVSSVLTCPLDVVKTRLQAQEGRRRPTAVSAPIADVAATPSVEAQRYLGLRGTLRKIWADDGIRGFYRGLGPTIFGYLPTWAIYFSVYDSCKTILARDVAGSGEEDFVNHIVSAMTAGAASTVCTSPLWVVKTRFMLQSSRSSVQRYRHTADAFTFSSALFLRIRALVRRRCGPRTLPVQQRLCIRPTLPVLVGILTAPAAQTLEIHILTQPAASARMTRCRTRTAPPCGEQIVRPLPQTLRGRCGGRGAGTKAALRERAVRMRRRQLLRAGAAAGTQLLRLGAAGTIVAAHKVRRQIEHAFLLGGAVGGGAARLHLADRIAARRRPRERLPHPRKHRLRRGLARLRVLQLKQRQAQTRRARRGHREPARIGGRGAADAVVAVHVVEQHRAILVGGRPALGSAPRERAGRRADGQADPASLLALTAAACAAAAAAESGATADAPEERGEERAEEAVEDDAEAENDEHAAVLAQKDEEACVVGVPAGSVKVGEEGVGRIDGFDVLAVERLREHADALEACVGLLGRRGEGGPVHVDVEAVGGGDEHGPGGEHDGGVVGEVLVVEVDEVVDELVHEGMRLGCEHDVVGDADGDGLGEDDLEAEEGVEAAEAANVEVHVDAAVVVEDKVADGVGTLDGVRVGVKDGEEPVVVLFDEASRRGVGPEHVFVVWVHLFALVTDGLPAGRQMLVLPGLVDDAWDLFCRIGGVPGFWRVVAPWLRASDGVFGIDGVVVGVGRGGGSGGGRLGELGEPGDACGPGVGPVWRVAGLDLLPRAEFFGEDVGGGVDGEVGVGGCEDDDGACEEESEEDEEDVGGAPR
ncbi:hypothetical protein L1887_63205 [Cichorium endivia]|nr:hypothetical protein L1887_63205 [Cichorium endivia]